MPGKKVVTKFVKSQNQQKRNREFEAAEKIIPRIAFDIYGFTISPFGTGKGCRNERDNKKARLN